jgi:hypothetical protein
MTSTTRGYENDHSTVITAVFDYEKEEWVDNRPKRPIEILVDSVCEKRKNKEPVWLVDFLSYYNFYPAGFYLGFVNWLIDHGELNMRKLLLDSDNILSEITRLRRTKVKRRFEVWKAMFDLYAKDVEDEKTKA